MIKLSKYRKTRKKLIKCGYTWVSKVDNGKLGKCISFVAKLHPTYGSCLNWPEYLIDLTGQLYSSRLGHKE